MNEIWLRHPNGSGRIYGNDAFATAESFLDRGSSIGDDVEVYDPARITNSVISDNSIVHGSVIEDSLIQGSSRLIGDVLVRDSTLCDVHAWGRPVIDNCSLTGVFVFGEAVVEGVSLNAHVRIHQGWWTRAPRYEVLKSGGLAVTVSECVSGCFHLGCWAKTYAEWTRKGYRQILGKRAGWQPWMVERCFELFTDWNCNPWETAER